MSESLRMPPARCWSAAIRLAELLRQVRRIAPDQQRAGTIRKPSHLVVVRTPIERHHDVEPLRTRRFDPALEPELEQEIAKCECRRMQNFRLVLARIEIEHANIGVPQVRDARGPHVKRDAVLIRQPEQRARIGDDGMMDCASLLLHFDALQPFGKTLRNIFLKEALLTDAPVISFHRYGPTANMRQHGR